MHTEKLHLLHEINGYLADLCWYGEQETVNKIRNILRPIVEDERSKSEDCEKGKNMLNCYDEDLKWTRDKLYNYDYLDSLNDEEFKRFVLSCLLLIVNAIQPEHSEYKDGDNKGELF